MGVLFNEVQLTKKQIRQMQLIQLEILVELDRICQKEGIRYSLDGGTLLGAVRHKGFIPWDDDIDIIMLRDEYERFFEVCQNELDKERFFLQEERTDPYYRNGYTRIRREGSVYLRAGHEHMKYHTGIFIDIFILDNVPNNKFFRRIHRFISFTLRKILWSESGKVLHQNFFARKWFGVLSHIPVRFVFILLSKLAKCCNLKKTELVRHITHPYPNSCKYGIKRDYIEELSKIEFEGYNFCGSKHYHKYLTDLYGDYMTLPPVDKQQVHIHLSEFVPVKPQLENKDLITKYFD